jgi:hypothetical protein
MNWLEAYDKPYWLFVTLRIAAILTSPLWLPLAMAYYWVIQPLSIEIKDWKTEWKANQKS